MPEFRRPRIVNDPAPPAGAPDGPTPRARAHPDRAVLTAAFARIDPIALAVAMGCVFAVALFLMTAVLLLKGAPSGAAVGPHLSVLAKYFPGFSVSWMGGAIGALYAWVLGAAMGFVWALLWNLSHFLYIILVVLRAQWWRMMAN